MGKKCFPRLRVVRTVHECIDRTGSLHFWVEKPTENNHCRGLEFLHSFYAWSLLLWAMTCFSNTPTQCPSVRLLVLCSTISRDHLEMALKEVGKESFLSCKSPSLTLTQLNSGRGDKGVWGSNSRPTLVRLLQHLQLQVMEVIWGRGRTQVICQTHEITISFYPQSFPCSSVETVQDPWDPWQGSGCSSSCPCIACIALETNAIFVMPCHV